MKLRAVAGLVVVSAILGACEKPQQASKPAEPLAPTARLSVHDIMFSMVDPAADAVWESVATISDATGVHEIRPRTDEDWAKLRQSAAVLVEAPNLLAMNDRRLALPGQTLEPGGTLDQPSMEAAIRERHDAFAANARNFQDVALQVLSAIEAHDVGRLEEAGGALDAACEACHMAFWYPPAPDKTKS